MDQRHRCLPPFHEIPNAATLPIDRLDIEQYSVANGAKIRDVTALDLNTSLYQFFPPKYHRKAYHKLTQDQAKAFRQSMADYGRPAITLVAQTPARATNQRRAIFPIELTYRNRCDSDPVQFVLAVEVTQRRCVIAVVVSLSCQGYNERITMTQLPYVFRNHSAKVERIWDARHDMLANKATSPIMRRIEGQAIVILQDVELARIYCYSWAYELPSKREPPRYRQF